MHYTIGFINASGAKYCISTGKPIVPSPNVAKFNLDSEETTAKEP